MKAKETKRKEAKARAEEYEELSPEVKVALLDRKFGKGKGAKKQRAKLEKEISSSGISSDS